MMAPHASLGLTALLLATAACSSSPEGEAAPADAGGEAQAEAGPPLCADGLPVRAFTAGGTGQYRRDVVGDAEVPLLDGGTLTLSAAFDGCESFVFVPDSIPRSDSDPTSIWESDVAELLAASPRSVQYLFWSRAADGATATARLTAMRGRLDAALATLPAEAAEHWRTRVHLVGVPGAELPGWLGTVATTHGRIGFAVDRTQRLRGLGSLADVTRVDAAAQAAGAWPWMQNLAYVAHEARWFDALARREQHLATDGATVVRLFDGEVLAQFEETDVALPDAAAMAGFDTLEIEVESGCPDPTLPELGNCGAWDYLAHLFVRDEPSGENVELARFITTYHRESHWLVDASPLLPLLAAGGSRHFRWEFAPEWNTQPTATRLALRFSNQGKGRRPVSATPLFTGGAFDATYNASRVPAEVPIPATATHVELVAIITGHGGAALTNCAEFCNHQHQFTVGATRHRKDHPEVGQEQGCLPQMDLGMTPNQAGTWWFGRGGWCPGQGVQPWVVDVTGDVTPGGTASVSYRATYNSSEPFNSDANIVLSSWLVVWE